MRGQPIANFIWLGLAWRYLQDSKSGYPIHGHGLVDENISLVIERIEKFGLQVTHRAAYELIAIQSELKGTPADAKLTAAQAAKLSDTMRELQRTLSAESSGSMAYIVTDKRLDIQKLLGNPEKLFAPNVFSLLPTVAQYDFREAGYCIAFERPTAAAFHLLRGTEDVLRSYYCSIVQRNRLKSLLWGPITLALSKRRRPPAAELLRNLDNIRLSFRNPTQHPDKIYDIHEVQDLFGLCIDVVNRMVKSSKWTAA